MISSHYEENGNGEDNCPPTDLAEVKEVKKRKKWKHMYDNNRQYMLEIIDGRPSAGTAQYTQYIVYHSLMFFFVVVSCTVLCLRTLPEFYQREEGWDLAFAWIELGCIIIFTLELVLLFALSYNRCALFKRFLIWVDILVVVPVYVEYLIVAFTGKDIKAIGALAILRSLRAFRIIRIARYNVACTIVWESLKHSAVHLLLLLALLGMVVIVFSLLIFLAEGAISDFDETTRQWIRDGEVSPYQSIPESTWWALVTVTTVGYGDAFPIGGWGQLVACMAASVGILVLSFPIVAMSQNFCKAYSQHLAANGRANDIGDTLSEKFPNRQGRAKQRKPSTFREKVNSLFNWRGPHSNHRWSLWARVVIAIIFVAILMSILTIILGSLPVFWAQDSRSAANLTFFIMDTIALSVFVIEWFVRLWAVPDRCQYLKSAAAWLDLIAWVSLLADTILWIVRPPPPGQDDGVGTFLQVLRVLRLVRLIRVMTINKHLAVVIYTLKHSSDGLMLMVFILIISILVFGSAIYYAEQYGATFNEQERVWIRDETGIPTFFQSIPDSFSWVVITMTTVGYGDRYPEVWPGQLVASIVILSGLLMITFPLLIVGVRWQEAIEYMEKLHNESIKSDSDDDSDQLDQEMQPNRGFFRAVATNRETKPKELANTQYPTVGHFQFAGERRNLYAEDPLQAKKEASDEEDELALGRKSPDRIVANATPTHGMKGDPLQMLGPSEMATPMDWFDKDKESLEPIEPLIVPELTEPSKSAKSEGPAEPQNSIRRLSMTRLHRESQVAQFPQNPIAAERCVSFHSVDGNPISTARSWMTLPSPRVVTDHLWLDSSDDDVDIQYNTPVPCSSPLPEYDPPPDACCCAWYTEKRVHCAHCRRSQNCADKTCLACDSPESCPCSTDRPCISVVVTQESKLYYHTPLLLINPNILELKTEPRRVLGTHLILEDSFAKKLLADAMAVELDQIHAREPASIRVVKHNLPRGVDIRIFHSKGKHTVPIELTLPKGYAYKGEEDRLQCMSLTLALAWSRTTSKVGVSFKDTKPTQLYRELVALNTSTSMHNVVYVHPGHVWNLLRGVATSLYSPNLEPIRHVDIQQRLFDASLNYWQPRGTSSLMLSSMRIYEAAKVDHLFLQLLLKQVFAYEGKEDEQEQDAQGKPLRRWNINHGLKYGTLSAVWDLVAAAPYEYPEVDLPWALQSYKWPLTGAELEVLLRKELYILVSTDGGKIDVLGIFLCCIDMSIFETNSSLWSEDCMVGKQEELFEAHMPQAKNQENLSSSYDVSLEQSSHDDQA